MSRHRRLGSALTFACLGIAAVGVVLFAAKGGGGQVLGLVLVLVAFLIAVIGSVVTSAARSGGARSAASSSDAAFDDGWPRSSDAGLAAPGLAVGTHDAQDDHRRMFGFDGGSDAASSPSCSYDAGTDAGGASCSADTGGASSGSDSF